MMLLHELQLGPRWCRADVAERYQHPKSVASVPVSGVEGWPNLGIVCESPAAPAAGSRALVYGAE
jgi:hypothetical protein